MTELLKGFGILAIYFIVAASTALILHKLIRIPDEVFRKTLHLILLASLLIWTLVFDTWYIAVLAVVIFVVLVYPILGIAERWKGYSQMLTERNHGEIRRSLVLVFGMYAFVMTICRGIFQDRLLGLCSICAWGFGDGAAALIGKRFGRHKLEGRFIEGKKSVEGTAAMFAVSFLSVVIVLAFRGGMAWYLYPVIALPTALVSALVELFTKHGLDTATCPICAMIVILPLVQLLGGSLG